MNTPELKELLANATPGEWKWDAERHEINSNYRDVAIILDEDYGNLYFPEGCGDDVTGNERNEANARLIALAPQLAADNIALQAEVERLHEIVEDLEEKLRQEMDALKTMKPLW